MKDIVKGIEFLAKIMFYGAIGEIFAHGIFDIIESGALDDMMKVAKRVNNDVYESCHGKKKEPEARKIGFVCEK